MTALLLGSREHYGWEKPITVQLVAVFDGPDCGQEFAWLTGPGRDASSDRFDVMVRPRFSDPAWHEPLSGERVEVAAWQLQPDDLDALQAIRDAPGAASWQPPKPLPDLWLWVGRHDDAGDRKAPKEVP